MLRGHLPVEGVPVVVSPAGGGEHLAQQQPETLPIHARVGVVGPDQLGEASVAAHAHPERNVTVT